MFDNRNARRAALMSAVTLSFGLYGCRGPVAPSTPATSRTTATSTTTEQVTLWTVTYTPVSLTGSACGISIGSGPSMEPLTVALTPETVDFKPGEPKYWEPVDFDEYTGPRTGASFVARKGPYTYTIACGTVTSETTITGTFSDDGSHLTAQQVDSIKVGDAHVIRIYSWSADRRSYFLDRSRVTP
jgi:hypothetical protein